MDTVKRPSREERVPITPKEKIEDTITLPKSDFDKVISTIKDLEKDNKMLKEVADKGRMARWQSQHSDFRSKIVKVSTIDGKIVDGWRMIKDEVGKNVTTGVWFENQVVEVHFTDDTKKEMNYADFVRRNVKIQGEVIRSSNISDEYGAREMLTVNIDGKEVDLDVRFIN